ncbi:MAG: hypothetical protein QME12_00745 [Nanoarchaeota archaeon]|nr:hypothetical protein [Nanoarchaeota archaeon]
MIQACIKQGLPEPKFEERQGFRVVFRKDAFSEEYLKSINLNERQIKAVVLAKRKGEITNKQYRELFGITDRTALRDLNAACEKGVFQRIGVTGRETKYALPRHKPDINPT